MCVYNMYIYFIDHLCIDLCQDIRWERHVYIFIYILGQREIYMSTMSVYIYMYIIGVCVCERERMTERERDRE